MTTAGDAAPSCLFPNTRQRSAVKISMDQPCSASKGGSTAMVAARTTITAAASNSRPRTLAINWRSIRQSHQPAHDGDAAWLGLGIYLEDGLVRAGCRPIGGAGNQRSAPAGEIVVTAADKLVAVDVERVGLARLIDALNGQHARGPYFQHGRQAVDCGLLTFRGWRLVHRGD